MLTVNSYMPCRHIAAAPIHIISFLQLLDAPCAFDTAAECAPGACDAPYAQRMFSPPFTTPYAAVRRHASTHGQTLRRHFVNSSLFHHTVANDARSAIYDASAHADAQRCASITPSPARATSAIPAASHFGAGYVCCLPAFPRAPHAFANTPPASVCHTPRYATVADAIHHAATISRHDAMRVAPMPRLPADTRPLRHARHVAMLPLPLPLIRRRHYAACRCCLTQKIDVAAF